MSTYFFSTTSLLFFEENMIFNDLHSYVQTVPLINDILPNEIPSYRQKLCPSHPIYRFEILHPNYRCQVVPVIISVFLYNIVAQLGQRSQILPVNNRNCCKYLILLIYSQNNPKVKVTENRVITTAKNKKNLLSV